MRKIILYTAVSLDGFLADKEGGVGWLEEQEGSYEEDYEGDYGISRFLEGIDTVIMGYGTYYQIITELSPKQWIYSGKHSYVLTHREGMKDTEEIRFVKETAGELAKRLKRQEGRDIWLCGGADTVRQFLERDLIDEFHITIMPVLLGDGIRLFERMRNRLLLRLVSVTRENGAVDCVYVKR